MTQDRVKGKFYPLQHDEWLRACQELTPAQRDVLYFIRTLDPYGNGIRISAAEIARRLSTPQKTVHRQTISRALKELDTKEFIDLELLEVQVEVKPKGYWCDETPAVRQDTSGAMRHRRCDETPAVRQDTSGAMRHRRCDETPAVRQDTSVDRETPQVIATHHATAETQSGQGSDLSKTYKTFKDSLSDSERGKFLDFVRKQIENFPQPINDLEAWLASTNKAGEKRWFVYYQNFLSQKQPQEKAPKKRRLHEEIEQRKREMEQREMEQVVSRSSQSER